MSYRGLDFGNNIEVDSVSSFIESIKNMMDNEEGLSTEFYFRGQEAEFWDIEPSIFRDDMLSIEHRLMQIPKQKTPIEFKELDSMFDVMTKYQHYGMCTRLLDLTTNPLVALYFACKIHGNEKYQGENCEIEKEPYGIVYYTNNYYPSQSTDKEIEIISALASYDLQKENTIYEVLAKLERDGIIDEKTKKNWMQEEHVKDFIDIIQRNYMVIPTYTNERLKRQNGVFLLTSMFTVNIGDGVQEGIITKSKSNLRKEFADKYFYIKGENKEEILKELDLYNINEATLFPELEHQLNYIRNSNSNYTQSVSDFFKFEEQKKEINKSIWVDDTELNDYIIDLLDGKLRDIVEEADVDEIKNIIITNMTVDWYKRSSSSSKIKMAIMEYYLKKKESVGKVSSKEKASKVLSMLNAEIKAYIDIKNKGD